MKSTYLIRNEHNAEGEPVRIEARSFRGAVAKAFGHGAWRQLQNGKIQQKWRLDYGSRNRDGSYAHSATYVVTKVMMITKK